jgi:hypothetical protein
VPCFRIGAVALTLALAGCMSEDVLRYDGVTTGVGNAIAANTAMQMVDPWPAGVEDTHLRTPAVRETATSEPAMPGNP